MGIKDFASDYKYPILALAFLLIVYGFFLQNTDSASKITGFATVSAPTSLSYSTSTCTSTKISWSKPTTYPSGATIYYIAFYSIDKTFTYYQATSASTSTSRTLTGLPPGVPYYFKVLAYPSTSMADGSWSTSYKSFTQRCTPTGLAYTSVDCHSEKLTWTAPTGGGASGYYVAVSTSSSFPGSYPYTTTSTSYTVSGLSPSTTYYAKVAGYASIGGSDTSSTISFPTPSCTAISAPTLNPAQIKSCSSVYFSWSSVANAGGYVLYYWPSGSDPSTASSVMTGPSVPYATVTGLKGGTNYNWKVYAFSASDYYTGAYSTVATTGTLPACTGISAPTLNPAQVKDCSTVYFSWSSVANAGGYVLYYDTSSSFSAPASVMLSPTTNYYTATGLKGGTNYNWKVYAFSASDYYTGAYSAVATTGTLPACTAVTAPTNLVATANPSTCSIDFSWTKSNAANYRIDLAFSKTELEGNVRAYILPSQVVTGSSYSWPNLKSMNYYWRIYAYSGDPMAGTGVYTATQPGFELRCANLDGFNPSPGIMYADEVKLAKAINTRRAGFPGTPQLAIETTGALNQMAEERAMEIFTLGFAHGPTDKGEWYNTAFHRNKLSPYLPAGENLGVTASGDDPAGSIFCCGSGSFVGHTEHDVNQIYSGYNAVSVGESVGFANYWDSITGQYINYPYNWAVEFIHR
jgi:hypothetical protein